MFKAIGSLVLGVALISSSAFAQGTTRAEAEDVTKDALDSPLTVTPAVGILGFQNSLGEYTSRLAEGFNLNWDIGNMIQIGRFKAGIETGFLFSHIGPPDGNLFGADSQTNISGGANSFIVPGSLVIGSKLGTDFLAAVKIGTQLIYRSDPNSMNLGRSFTPGDGSVDLFPSAGLDFGYAIGESIALSLRGDYIPTPADDAYTAMLGATIPIV
ncbi:MAG: hypothetical protein A2428_15810 [Bdellovibrionales bacterium RIFOXYC1_FULL_54_43]|nr:MAG: hypothetical protein A2428_15810 [Bdellovibrionales bacterium RIFOXYC1_FULL_54_43]OFZ85385.1 MAG: hypothetical protein A2603_00730 [Bdellovibrionales bacterium RIFOXYD1_FULL_55_31]